MKKNNVSFFLPGDTSTQLNECSSVQKATMQRSLQNPVQKWIRNIASILIDVPGSS